MSLPSQKDDSARGLTLLAEPTLRDILVLASSLRKMQEKLGLFDRLGE